MILALLFLVQTATPPPTEHLVELKEAHEIVKMALAIQGIELEEKKLIENRNRSAEILNQRVQKLQVKMKMEGCKFTLLPDVKWTCEKEKK